MPFQADAFLHPSLVSWAWPKAVEPVQTAWERPTAWRRYLRTVNWYVRKRCMHVAYTIDVEMNRVKGYFKYMEMDVMTWMDGWLDLGVDTCLSFSILRAVKICGYRETTPIVSHFLVSGHRFPVNPPFRFEWFRSNPRYPWSLCVSTFIYSNLGGMFKNACFSAYSTLLEVLFDVGSVQAFATRICHVMSMLRLVAWYCMHEWIGRKKPLQPLH